MRTNSTSCYLVIIFSLVLAVVLSLASIHLNFQKVVPSFVPMVLLYWAIVEPQKVNVGISWVAGLFLDLALGATLGIHASAMAFMTWSLVTFFPNIRFYSLLQKDVVVASINFVGQFLLFWSEHIFGAVTVDYNILLSCVATAILWPVCYVILNMLYSMVQTGTRREYE